MRYDDRKEVRPTGNLHDPKAKAFGVLMSMTILEAALVDMLSTIDGERETLRAMIDEEREREALARRKEEEERAWEEKHLKSWLSTENGTA